MKLRGSALAAGVHIQPSTVGVSTPVGGNVFPSNLSDYARIASALDYVAAHHREQPELADIAFEVGLSPYHFQRLFTRWAGISPKKFLQYVTLAEAKRSLAASASVLDAAYDAGLSGPGRLHDLFLACDSVTPGEFKALGAGLTLRYGFHPSAFGECLLLVSERGIVGLSFVAEDEREAALRRHMAGWPAAGVIADSCATAPYMERIFRAPEKTPSGEGPPLRLLLRGTRFQIKVWEALLRVPAGRLVAYGRIAEAIGCGPGAARAVGRACASNPIAYLIPCHRVIHKSGVIGDYRWGQTRKMALIGWEAAGADNQDGAA